MNIKEYIEKAHSAALSKGFYDCPQCEGDGNKKFDGFSEYCVLCQQTGKNQNKNIGELLMLVVSELGEALEAHRSGKFADQTIFDKILNNEMMEHTHNRLFELKIKDTFEDELADVFIRLFDLCGYLKLDSKVIQHVFDNGLYYTFEDINVGELFFTFINHELGRLYNINTRSAGCMGETLAYLYMVCQILNIPIEKHIQSKMEYNETRDYKHGKEY